MKYALTENGKLVFDLKDWSPTVFQTELFNSYGLSVSLPVAEPTEYIQIGERFVLYPTVVTTPDLKPDEKAGTATFTIGNDGKATYSQKVQKLSSAENKSKLAALKADVFAALSRKRKVTEESGITITIGGKSYTINSDKDSQGRLDRAYRYMTDAINWKCLDNVTWVTLDKDGMLSVIQALNAHINTCFAKEAVLQNKLNTLNITEVDSFDINAEWEKA